MSLLVAWILFPALVLAACLGLGLLVERAAGFALPAVLLLPAGLAAIIVVTQLLVWVAPLAILATPVVLLAAVIGLVLGRSRLAWRELDPWAAAAGVGVFAVFAAPVVLSGDVSFAGYTLLGDTAVHFELIDRLMSDGANVDGMAPSTVRESLDAYFSTSYPTGAHTALGALRPVTGQDVAWVYQPFLAVLVVMVALSLYALIAPVVPRRPLRAAVAFIAAQPGLVYAYALEGSIKELATIALLTLLAALLPVCLSAGAGVRRVVPLAVASAAALGVIDVAVGAWLGPLLLAGCAVVVWRGGRAAWRGLVREAAVYGLLTIVLALPTVAGVGTFLDAAQGVLTDDEGLGNLLAPLNELQVFGIWPRGTFLLPLSANAELIYMLIGVAALSGLLGLVWLVRRRAWAPLLFFGVSLIGWLVVSARGGPWADAKALMILSPAVVLVSLLGAISLESVGRRVEGLIVLAVVAGGVVWTNALAYHDADLAPPDRFRELAAIGERFDGQGPTVYTEFEEFNKHFLRETDPTGTGESFQPFPGGVRRGAANPFGFSTDLDVFTLDYLDRFRTMVVRRSPTASRPPSDFRRAHRGDYYEVWQRDGRSGTRVLAHFPFGTRLQRGARPTCLAARRIAGQARDAGAQLSYAPAPTLPVFVPTKAAPPRGWIVPPEDPDVFRPDGQGRVDGSVAVPYPGRYTVWAEGSFGRPVEIALDGRVAGTASYHLNPRREWLSVGTAELAPGRLDVDLVRGGGSPRPGNGGINRLVGPVALEPVGVTDRPVRTLAPSQWRRLCAQGVDWIEIVRS